MTYSFKEYIVAPKYSFVIHLITKKDVSIFEELCMRYDIGDSDGVARKNSFIFFNPENGRFTYIDDNKDDYLRQYGCAQVELSELQELIDESQIDTFTGSVDLDQIMQF